MTCPASSLASRAGILPCSSPLLAYCPVVTLPHIPSFCACSSSIGFCFSFALGLLAGSLPEFPFVITLYHSHLPDGAFWKLLYMFPKRMNLVPRFLLLPLISFDSKQLRTAPKIKSKLLNTAYVAGKFI